MNLFSLITIRKDGEILNVFSYKIKWGNYKKSLRCFFMFCVFSNEKQIFSSIIGFSMSSILYSILLVFCNIRLTNKSQFLNYIIRKCTGKTKAASISNGLQVDTLM